MDNFNIFIAISFLFTKMLFLFSIIYIFSCGFNNYSRYSCFYLFYIIKAIYHLKFSASNPPPLQCTTATTARAIFFIEGSHFRNGFCTLYELYQGNWPLPRHRPIPLRASFRLQFLHVPEQCRLRHLKGHKTLCRQSPVTLLLSLQQLPVPFSFHPWQQT